MDLSHLLPYAVRKGPQLYITESSVTVPPAAVITDSAGRCWTIGLRMQPRGLCPNGHYAFDVLCNGMPVGEAASHIEYFKGRLRIFTVGGWKRHRLVDGQHVFI